MQLLGRRRGEVEERSCKSCASRGRGQGGRGRVVSWQSMAEILIVDDDGHIREVVRFALERAGHAVREAADGRAALDAIAARAPDLVVLDIVMPEEDGLSTCRTIRQRSRLPIIFLSSRDDELDRVLGLELGGDDYVSKPFSPRELVARVAAVLRRSEAVSAAAGREAR